MHHAVPAMPNDQFAAAGLSLRYQMRLCRGREWVNRAQYARWIGVIGKTAFRPHSMVYSSYFLRHA